MLVKIKKYNKKTVYNIDGISTIITSVHNNIAKGYIINKDLTLTKTYIAKGQNIFSHGETIKKAIASLEAKILRGLDVETNIQNFINKFKKGKKYEAFEFYKWHYILTGSCEQGRKSFVKNHNINLNKDKFTVSEFIKITENSYCSNVIQQLKLYYEVI